MTVRAIYENGVFKPAAPVNLPDRAEVELEARVISKTPDQSEQNQKADAEIAGILSRRYDTGQTDAAERHNEHQP